MDPYAKHAAAIARLEVYLGDACPTFTWAGADYKAFPSGSLFQKKAQAGGFLLEEDLTLLARADQFPDPGPAVKQLISYPGAAGQLYRIDSITTLPGGTLLKFHLNHPDQST